MLNFQSLINDNLRSYYSSSDLDIKDPISYFNHNKSYDNRITELDKTTFLYNFNLSLENYDNSKKIALNTQFFENLKKLNSDQEVFDAFDREILKLKKNFNQNKIRIYHLTHTKLLLNHIFKSNLSINSNFATSRNGKCAASVIGGALGGALAGIWGGAKAGALMTGGTPQGAIVGGVLGGAFGSIAGALSAYGNSKSCGGGGSCSTVGGEVHCLE